MAPTITALAMTSTYDIFCPQNSSNFLTDVNAVQQIIQQRLLLFQGEWFENTLLGLPLWQNILGKGVSSNQKQQIELLIQQQILGTPYVTGISNVQVNFDSNFRGFAFSCDVQTQFGTTTASFNFPTVQSRALPTL